MNDCAVHVNGPRHKQYAASKSSQPTLADFSKAKQDQDNLTHQGAVSIRKTVLPGMAIPMLKIRRPNGRLIFNMEIAIRR